LESVYLLSTPENAKQNEVSTASSWDRGCSQTPSTNPSDETRRRQQHTDGKSDASNQINRTNLGEVVPEYEALTQVSMKFSE